MAICQASSEQVEVAVFARAPVPGRAKTRLLPALGSVGAARLQRRLTLRALSLAHAAAIGPVTLWAADCRHRFFRALQARSSVDLRSQIDGDLGARMAAAFAAHGGPLLLIGSDCPALSVADLAAAAKALHETGKDAVEAVFIPAEDGGYVLVGLRRPQPLLFSGIDWGSQQVMAQTRERLGDLGLRWQELPALWDVDRPEDLARLAVFEEFAEWLR